MVPNYLQTWGIARGLGCQVHSWPLLPDEERGRWRLDLKTLEGLLTPRTRLLWICNPNNPTGATFTAEELDGLAALAERHGTWILSDEVYRGGELGCEETASMWGRYPRTLVTAGLSKAYGLPGLRIGWVLGPPETVAELWAARDYTTIAPGALSDHLARLALARRPELLERTRRVLQENYSIVRSWLESHGEFFSHIPPRAGAMLFMRYHHTINSTALADRLREEKSVLVVPGDHYGMDGYLRLGYGTRQELLAEGLERISSVLRAL
jgi:aspartate/methionine/tyrosine aminotransferase